MPKSEKKDKKKKEAVEAEPEAQDVEMTEVDVVRAFHLVVFVKF